MPFLFAHYIYTVPQVQQYIVTIPTLQNVWSFKEAEGWKESKYMFIVCCINLLIHHSWFSSFVTMDSICHLVIFPSFNTALFLSPPLCSYCQICHISTLSLYGQQYNYSCIWLLFKSLKKRKEKTAFILSFIVMWSPGSAVFLCVCGYELMSGITWFQPEELPLEFLVSYIC